MRRVHWLLMVVVALLLPSAVSAQAERFELGRRLQAAEAAWEAHAEAEARRRALPYFKQAVGLFFARRPGEAGRALDRARFALVSPVEPSLVRQWAASLELMPETRLADPDSLEIQFTLAAFYTVNTPPPVDARLMLSLKGPGRRSSPPRSLTRSFASLPFTGRLPVRGLSEGDYILRAEILAGKQLLEVHEQTLSLARSLTARLERLQRAAEGVLRGGIEGETLRGLAGLLESLLDGNRMETSYPAARLLAEAEAIIKARAEGESYYGQKKAGQFWLTLPSSTGPTPSRLLAPTAVKHGAPLPLVIAMHGAGGSENLFFEGYGQGMIVRLCEQRGYLLLAPRSAGFNPARALELIEAVAKLYPVDRQRVFLVGHSMGAMQAVSSALNAPRRYAGVAVLGGGGVVRESAGLRELPFFIGIGRDDFVLRSALSLGEALTQAGVGTVRLREYPDVEHLVIVQAALPEVFAFFDEIAKRHRAAAP